MATVRLPALKAACKAAVSLQAIKRRRAHEWRIHANRVNAVRAFFRRWCLMFWLKPLTIQQIIAQDSGYFEDWISPDMLYLYHEDLLKRILRASRCSDYVDLSSRELDLLEVWQ